MNKKSIIITLAVSISIIPIFLIFAYISNEAHNFQIMKNSCMDNIKYEAGGDLLASLPHKYNKQEELAKVEKASVSKDLWRYLIATDKKSFFNDNYSFYCFVDEHYMLYQK